MVFITNYKGSLPLIGFFSVDLLIFTVHLTPREEEQFKVKF